MFITRFTLNTILTGLIGLAAICPTGAHSAEGGLQVGFARIDITPPVGTPMTGFGAHFSDKEGARKIHDPV
ncbi:MAG: hypothetical protein KC931_13990, partial [Candidatus Omnitrophica bacterium]|nr:hypothetical protein [Candidatus Omnitrophota bacterium]